MTDEIHKIKVVGVGGAGGNAINNMISHNLEKVKFIAINTDSQALLTSQAETKIQIGEQLTEGLGAGGNPDRGREAALENTDNIKEALKDSHMVFIAAGLGGGTGTGAAPVIAKLSKEIGALTVAVVTRPFFFEGKKRAKLAEAGLNELREVTDTLITIPNDRLVGIAPKNTPMIEMFNRVDEILNHSVKAITDLIFKTGYINLDFADLKTTMSKSGMAIMGIGSATGDNRALEAAQKAISHPLLEDISIKGAKYILMNITASKNVTIQEMTEASKYIHSEAGDDVDVYWGCVYDDSVGDEMKITVIATGIGSGPEIVSHHDRSAIKRVRPDVRIRDYNVEDLKYKSNETTIMPKKKSNDDGQHIIIPSSYPNSKGLIIDKSDLDIPTFLRKKAD